MAETATKKNELTRLINSGFPFEIEYSVRKRNPGILGFFSPKKSVREKRTFVIKEPTLATLDKIALASMDIDTELFSDEKDFKTYLKKNSQLHFRKMAEIIAISVAADELELKELTELFFSALTPASLLEIIHLIDVASNLQDFMTSTLMVTAARAHTAKAESVEKELPDYEAPTEDAE